MRLVSGSDASSSASGSWSFFLPGMMRLRKEMPFLQLRMRVSNRSAAHTSWLQETYSDTWKLHRGGLTSCPGVLDVARHHRGLDPAPSDCVGHLRPLPLRKTPFPVASRGSSAQYWSA